MKMKIIEAEGRANLYGSSASAPDGSGVGRPANAQFRHEQVQHAEKSGSCNLLGNAASAELTKCLEQFNR